jgi:hypothetical protein
VAQLLWELARETNPANRLSVLVRAVSSSKIDMVRVERYFDRRGSC